MELAVEMAFGEESLHAGGNPNFQPSGSQLKILAQRKYPQLWNI